MTTDVKEIVSKCDEMIAIYGHIPSTITEDEYKYHLGTEWGQVFHTWYLAHPKAKIGVRNGLDMAIPAIDNYIEKRQEAVSGSPDLSQESPAS